MSRTFIGGARGIVHQPIRLFDVKWYDLPNLLISDAKLISLKLATINLCLGKIVVLRRTRAKFLTGGVVFAFAKRSRFEKKGKQKTAALPIL